MNKPSKSNWNNSNLGDKDACLKIEAARMSDDQIRYQVEAHERQNDVSWTFDVYIAEYRKRGLRAVGDWQDAGEIIAGA